MVHIALVLMLKNEEKRLHVTLDSVVGFVQSLVVYDTGSTDSTISILKTFAKKHKISLRLKYGQFEDYSTSRNILLDFADTFLDIDYLLLLDCNDELRGGDVLLQLCDSTLRHSSDSAWHLHQEWFSGDATNSYYNVRFFRPRHHWRYKGVIHEFLINLKHDKGIQFCPRFPENIIIYQDRTLDDNKSILRFPRDAELLLKECHRNPTDARSHFYLAQTYSCMRNLKEAFRYYFLRTKLKGFDDEVFHCWHRMGLITEELAKSEDRIIDFPETGRIVCTWELASTYFLTALEWNMRVEPLLRLGNHYIEKKQWEMAYQFIRWACMLQYPSTSLFVDKYTYDYTRYHMLGIAAFYCKKYKEGIVACKIAIDKGQKEIDKFNLKFYEEEMKKQNINN